MSNLVSVIIPCYKQGHFLADAIRSALEQDYPSKEVVVINDGSPDHTEEVASSFGNAIVYVKRTNMGLSAARNAGIRVSRGTYVALLDSDDAYLPDSLSTQAGFLDMHPDIALVCGDAYLSDGSRILGLKSSVQRSPHHPANFRWDTVGCYITPSTAMVRRSCFERVGLFEESLRGGAEDWFMWVRMSLHFNMTYLDQPLIYYRVHGQNATTNHERIGNANRMASALIVDSPFFVDYPAHFRSRLLFYRFATTWHEQPKRIALKYLLQALKTDPTQALYGLQVVRQGITNTIRRYRQS